MDFGRLITAMVTPFDQNGEINWDETARLIEHLIVEQKSDSLLLQGQRANRQPFAKMKS